MNKLSHSQINRYLDCPESHRLHYKEKLRSVYLPSAFMFGTALDVSVGAMLKGLDYVQEYSKILRFQDVHGKQVYLPNFENILYSAADLDADVFHEDDYKAIAVEAGKENFKIEDIETLIRDKEYLGGFDQLPLDLKKLHNYIHWRSLYNKGLIMLESFKQQIVPNITKVLSLQETVNLTNGEDSVVGFIDMVLEYKGYNKPIIFDLKTASRNYEKNAVLTSTQLSLYVHGVSDKYQDTRFAGYFVINKNLKKDKIKVCSVCKHNGTGSKARKCDNEIRNLAVGKDIRCNGDWIETIKCSAFIQTLINEIPQRFEENLIQNIDNINKAITQGITYKNLNSCVKTFGTKKFKCDFYDRCHNGSDKDLIKL